MSEAIETLAPEEMLTPEEIEAQLPKPVGYRVLVALPQVEETFGETGLLKSTTDSQNKLNLELLRLIDQQNKGQ